MSSGFRNGSKSLGRIHGFSASDRSKEVNIFEPAELKSKVFSKNSDNLSRNRLTNSKLNDYLQ